MMQSQCVYSLHENTHARDNTYTYSSERHTPTLTLSAYKLPRDDASATAAEEWTHDLNEGRWQIYRRVANVNERG